jgi:hypothetical protein
MQDTLSGRSTNATAFQRNRLHTLGHCPIVCLNNLQSGVIIVALLAMCAAEVAVRAVHSSGPKRLRRREMHSALYSLTAEAQRYEALAQRAEEALASPQPGSVSDEELTLFMREIARKSRDLAEVARRLLTQHVAE